MLSTKTIILIVVGLVILFFIYKSMKKCEGYTGDGKMTLNTKKDKTIDISSYLNDIETKLRIEDPSSSLHVRLYGGRKGFGKDVDPNFEISFSSSSPTVKMLDVMKDQTGIVNGILKLKDIERKQVGNLININNELNNMTTYLKNQKVRVRFQSKTVEGGFDKLLIIIN